MHPTAIPARRAAFTLAVASALCLAATGAFAQSLKITHQWPAKDEDPRHSAMGVLAQEISKAGVGLSATVHGGESLLKSREQWGALKSGTIDIALVAADGSKDVPETQILLLPGVVGSAADAVRVEKSPAMQQIRARVEATGVRMMSGLWAPGGVGSTAECVTDPAHLEGKATRAPGEGLEMLFAAAGGTKVDLPSTQIPNALKTGALDVVATSLQTFHASKVWGELKCLTVPGEKGLVWIRFGINVSKASWEKLNDAQKKALEAAIEKSVAHWNEVGGKADKASIEAYREKGVKIEPMTAAQYAKWRALAEKSVFAGATKAVTNGAQLVEAMR
jgi:TRAP-type C4-dicarboxylate transport system substrate-binding protein